MKNIIKVISKISGIDSTFLENNLIDSNLLNESFMSEEMKEYFKDSLYLIGPNDYIYLFENTSDRTKTVSVFEFLKAILGLNNKFKNANLKFFYLENDSVIEIEQLLASMPISLEKYSPDFDYILSEFEECNDNELKKTIKLKIFTEIIKYIYKDTELKALMTTIINNK